MSILRQKVEIEESFEKNGVVWRHMDDKTYKKVVAGWRDVFEARLACRDYVAKTGAAIEMLESNLPFSGYVFNLPNYSHLPVTPSAFDSTYGYIVDAMKTVDRSTLNRAEAVLSEANFRFTCVFNHEGESMIPEIFVEA